MIHKKKHLNDAQKAQEALQQEQIKRQEEQMEKVVVFARETILPFLKDKNFNVDATKIFCDTLAVTIQQGMFNLVVDRKVSELDLLGKISDKFPNAAEFRGLIELINDSTLQQAIETLQWMTRKIDAVLKEENKKRDFVALNLEF
jgi:hypothetical protein